MTPWLRAGMLLVLGLLAACAGWRSLVHGLADAALQDSPGAALRWMPGHPQALLGLARQQAADGDPSAAAATARRLLDREPLQGEAWRLLAVASEAAGEPEQARAQYAEAIRLAPRDVPARIWLAQDALQRGDAAAAIAHLDGILRTAPHYRDGTLTVLIQFARDRDFREALAATLSGAPGWRNDFLRQLQRQGEQATVDAVFAALQRTGTLSRRERADWLEGMLRRGDWPQAYARWAGTVPPEMALRPVYNGDFSRRPSGEGFDWRTPRKPGVQIGFPASGGIRITFRDRRIDHAGLEQALLLAPGRYRLVARMRTSGLRAERGIEWRVVCARPSALLGRSAPVRDAPDWQEVEALIEVPRGCTGQWLSLRNVARTPALQRLSGEITIASVDIEPVRGEQDRPLQD